VRRVSSSPSFPHSPSFPFLSSSRSNSLFYCFSSLTALRTKAVAHLLFAFPSPFSTLSSDHSFRRWRASLPRLLLAQIIPICTDALCFFAPQLDTHTRTLSPRPPYIIPPPFPSLFTVALPLPSFFSSFLMTLSR